MTVKQKQWQLRLLDCYSGKIDGLWGQQSKAGTIKLQRKYGLDDDGIFGWNTEQTSLNVIRKVQEMLNLFLKLGLSEDGLAGPKTEAAIRTYQEKCSLQVTGTMTDETWESFERNFDDEPESEGNANNEDGKTGTWWDDIKYFNREEFRCKCNGRYCTGFPVEPDEDMVRTADAIREHFGAPITPSSGIRCTQHNRNEGGAANSQHLYGTAVDLPIPGVSPKVAAAYAETLLPNTGGIGIYKWGIHIDTRKNKARWKG